METTVNGAVAAARPRPAGGAAVWLAVSWKPFELAWLALFGSVAAALALFYGGGPFAFSVYLAGIVCVVLAAKGHILNYAVGLYNCFGYGWIAMGNGLYGEAGLNFFFFAPMAAAGILVWRRSLARGGTVRMRRLRPAETLLLAAAAAALIAAGGGALALLEGQNSPYLDAATNVLSVAATLLMTWRYREQWLCYITLDVLTVCMWALRAADGSPEGALMTVMWTAYLVNAVYGWRVWTAGAAAEAEAEAPGPAGKARA
jgi:nicotinamide mononucleotide transporter